MRALVRTVALIPVAAIAAVTVAAYRIGLVRYLTAGRLLALVPGRPGVYLRRFWYRWTLAACGDDLIVEWLGVIKAPSTRIGRRVFVGSFSFVGESDIRDNVMIAHHSIVQGGNHTHGFERVDVTMRDQPGRVRVVTVGPDAWIGAGARVLTDVAQGTVVGAGAVVTRIAPAHAVIAGVPARVIRMRGQQVAERLARDQEPM